MRTSAEPTCWSRETSEPTFGEWVSGLARLSKVLGDKDLAARAVELIEGYQATLPASGRTGMGVYGWEKLVCGLVDAAAYAGYPAALELLAESAVATVTAGPRIPLDELVAEGLRPLAERRATG